MLNKRLIIGTTAATFKSGGIPSFINELKTRSDYQDSVFLEWNKSCKPNEINFGYITSNKFLKFFITQIKVFICCLKFRIIEVHSIRTGFIALLLFKKKCSFFYHGPGFQEYSVEGASTITMIVIYIVESLCLSKLNRYFTASNFFKYRLRENHGIPLNNIFVIRPTLSINRERYLFKLNEKLEKYRNTNIIKCIICRRLIQRVGILEFINEFEKIENNQNFLINIVGHGPLSDEINLKCKNLKNVIFHGQLSNESRDELYSDSLLNIVPSTHLEGLGMVILEGIKHGSMPLVTNCGGMPEYLSELNVGKVFNDSKDIVTNLDIDLIINELEKQNKII